jgi:hypothetical protein
MLQALQDQVRGQKTDGAVGVTAPARAVRGPSVDPDSGSTDA